jgi:methyltransferase (TIGR00027 family)
MRAREPSWTAMRAAAHRAAHQVVEQGRIFADPLAIRVLGDEPAAVFGNALDEPSTRGMRLLIAARSRFAEQSLAAAVERGVRQYVVLGAGLDTFAHRNPFADAGLRVFEVDHPATQAWKRARLAAAGLAPPSSLTFAPIDFERQTLGDALADVGFDAARPAVFAWLGVVIYLTRDAVLQTLAFIGGLPRGSEVIFDYGVPLTAYPAAQRAYHARRDAAVAARGEPWITRFEPAEIAAELVRLGFDALEDLGPAEIARRFLGMVGPDGPGPHLTRASRQLT